MLQTSFSDQNPYFNLLKWASLLLFPLAVLFHFDSVNQGTFLWLNSQVHTISPEAFWVVMTNFGDGFFLFPLTMLLFLRKPEKYLTIILTLLVGVLLINGGKVIIDSLRPLGELGHDMVHVIGPNVRKNSLPSGHTGTVFMMTALVMMHMKGSIRWVALLFGAVSAFSRIVVGAHWPQDLVWGIWAAFAATFVGSTLAVHTISGLKSRLFLLFLSVVCMLVLPFYDNGFQEGYGYIWYWQYALSLLSLGLVVAMLFDLYKIYIAPDLVVEGTLVNKLLRQVQRLIKFGIVGASGFVVDMGFFSILSIVLGVPHLVARGGSYWVSASWNWYWNRTFTFNHVDKGKKAPQWIKYLSMCLVSFFPNWGSYYLLTEYVPFFAEYKQLALVGGVLAGMMFNFTFASLFIFSPGKEAGVREG